jgi:predicted HicB family RNase H-like nuclease
MAYARAYANAGLRIPQKLHAELMQYATQRGMSLNELAVTLMINGIQGAKRSGKYKPEDKP